MPVVGSMAELKLSSSSFSFYPLPLSFLISLAVSSHLSASPSECQSPCPISSDSFASIPQGIEEVSWVPLLVKLAYAQSDEQKGPGGPRSHLVIS